MTDALDILDYNNKVDAAAKPICDQLAAQLRLHLPAAEAKVWHGHPVWFLEGNPIAGYSQMKSGIQLLFWSGQSFASPGLEPIGKFKAAGVTVKSVDEPGEAAIAAWLRESVAIQWDYQNLPKLRKLEKRTDF